MTRAVTRASQMMQDWPLRIEPLASYTPAIGRLVGMLTYARATTLAAVEGLTLPRINVHWAWFHVAEDEINHRGQIRLLRTRLPQRTIEV